jgi:leader peptidase (prepilin peptidase) / N-methyltransferase
MKLFRSSTSLGEVWRMLTPKDLAMVMIAVTISVTLGLVAAQPIEALFLALLAASAVIVAVCDLRYRIIPDLISLPLVAAGICFAGVQGKEAFVTHLATAAAIAALLLMLRAMYFRLRQRVGLGLGDVKMIAAAAAWLGPLKFPDYLLVAAVSALLQSAVFRSVANRGHIPFGPALAFSLWVFVCVATLARY